MNKTLETIQRGGNLGKCKSLGREREVAGCRFRLGIERGTARGVRGCPLQRRGSRKKVPVALFRPRVQGYRGKSACLTGLRDGCKHQPAVPGRERGG